MCALPFPHLRSSDDDPDDDDYIDPLDFEGAAQLCPFPTRALPGTEEKMLVLAARVCLGQELHHPLDATLPDRKMFQSYTKANGDHLRDGLTLVGVAGVQEPDSAQPPRQYPTQGKRRGVVLDTAAKAREAARKRLSRQRLALEKKKRSGRRGGGA